MADTTKDQARLIETADSPVDGWRTKRKFYRPYQRENKSLDNKCGKF